MDRGLECGISDRGRGFGQVLFLLSRNCKMVGLLLCFFYCAALLISAPCSLADAQSTDPSEVSALRVIKESLIDPTNHLRNWRKGDPCASNWTGILCNPAQDDGYMHIRELQLLKMGLSGSLAPELGNLTNLEILDFMWNNLTGSIPKEIGNIKTLRLLLLNGNQLSGTIPEEIGYLLNLDRLQIDQNQISGPIPESFANLTKVKHLHMNNNSLSGQIPHGLSTLLKLRHLLLDNNNLSGSLPVIPQDGQLKILQLDNNDFSGSHIPPSYGKTESLLKLSLRNCRLQGNIPDLSGAPLLYLDLSWNQLEGQTPLQNISANITTINLSNNLLIGNISHISTLPKLQRLSLQNNQLTGSVPSSLWQNINFTTNETLILDLQNNSFTGMSVAANPPANATVLLSGNPLCRGSSQLTRFCGPMAVTSSSSKSPENFTSVCGQCPHDKDYEYNPNTPRICQCAVPVGVGMRLKSPGISDFPPYSEDFQINLSSLLQLFHEQVYISSYAWEENGRRLNMHLKIFPNSTSLEFNVSEIVRLRDVLATWSITLDDIFGPYEFLNFTLGSYETEFPGLSKSSFSTGAVVGIVVGATVGVSTLCVIITVIVMKRRSKDRRMVSRPQPSSRKPIKVEGVKCFTFEEMALATKDFSDSSSVGEGGYGKVYRGVLLDGTVVAIKRAQEGSMQGSKEFSTEIELLSRLHHRNLVSLVGYCDEMEEQMLVYEYIPNGTLRDHLSGKSGQVMNFSMRLHVALGSARGILYLHTEANPPIFHRDIKASNILLDSKFVAKVADFGLSRLAPEANVEGLIPSHVSTVVKGTPGYLDPEYFLTHTLTDKSDVYSLGVVFLELLSGLPPISHGKNLVREVSMAYRSGETFSIIDSRMSSYPSECVEKFISLAIRCCSVEPVERPSMWEVVRELENISSLLPEDVSTPLSLPLTESNKKYQMLNSPFVSLDISSNDQSTSAISEIGSFAPR